MLISALVGVAEKLGKSPVFGLKMLLELLGLKGKKSSGSRKLLPTTDGLTPARISNVGSLCPLIATVVPSDSVTVSTTPLTGSAPTI
jgi:hypothetical protein